MYSKLILKIFVRLLALFYKESLIKVQSLLVKGKVWRELLQLEWVWERRGGQDLAGSSGSGPAVTGKRSHPC